MRRRAAIAWLGLAAALVALFAASPARDWILGRFKERCEVQTVEDRGPFGEPIQRQAMVCTRGRTKSISFIP